MRNELWGSVLRRENLIVAFMTVVASGVIGAAVSAAPECTDFTQDYKIPGLTCKSDDMTIVKDCGQISGATCPLGNGSCCQETVLGQIVVHCICVPGSGCEPGGVTPCP